MDKDAPKSNSPDSEVAIRQEPRASVLGDVEMKSKVGTQSGRHAFNVRSSVLIQPACHNMSKV